ncbi:AraC family transcriptional regulator [Pararhizobium capsulatum DSM 1112]|uniref:AraC family transcriptional regulator n=1 Tax=Pararhizobium capsulatum DSM 1112 TaxID=1121113 RepID=A0ABU0BUI6_9HYPH|nr:GyrI-like domain-containing protein [Pararhizobium capsulatum]MDQ0321913.1 AraC family transcriptional regulator [Pararhizobium capsulatum DSM 1112]
METNAQLSPRVAGSPAMLMAGMVREYTMGKIEGIPAQWQEFNRSADMIADPVGAVAYGICTHEDGKEGHFLYHTAMEVSGPSQLPAGFEFLSLPARVYAVFSHDGHVSGIAPLIQRIFSEWLPASDFRHGSFPDMIERYDQRFDPATATGVTEIWIPIES